MDSCNHWLEEDNLYVDGYHEVHDRDGNIVEKGEYLRGSLVNGISYNIILEISKHKEQAEDREPCKEEEVEFVDSLDYDAWKKKQTEEPVKMERIKNGEWSYCEHGRYETTFCLSYVCEYVKKLGLEYIYVVDKKIKLEGKMLKSTFTNFRTLEKVLAEKDPDGLDYLMTGILKYDQTDEAEVEIND